MLISHTTHPHYGGTTMASQQPPRQLYRVEWAAARAHDRPNDRRHKARTFSTAAAAARQVEAIERWEPSHTELLGIYITNTNWRDLERDALPAVEHPEEEQWTDSEPPTT